VDAHAWLAVPPGRSSMWRESFAVPRNDDDIALSCGGAYVSHNATSTII